MFVLDSFDIGSKYYWESMYVLFFELIRKIQFTCKVSILQTKSVDFINTFDTLCKIYKLITYIFRRKFVNFIRKFYTCYGLKLYILLKNTMKCAFNTTVKICSFCSISHGEICSQNQWKPCLNYCGIWNTDKISRIY